MGEGGSNVNQPDDGVTEALLTTCDVINSTSQVSTATFQSQRASLNAPVDSLCDSLLPSNDCTDCSGGTECVKYELLDANVNVIHNGDLSPSSCDLPPLYREWQINSTQCLPQQSRLPSNDKDNLIFTRPELSFFPQFKDITANESCSLVLPSLLDSKSTLSDSASAIFAICRICHMPGEEDEILITPCRCAGTLQFIHDTCLQRWLEICSKKSRKPPKCELCQYQYHRHKKFKFSHFRFPKVSFQDKVLHIIFLINLMLMIGCAIATVMCFLSDNGQIRKLPRNNVELSTEEIITLACGIIFFVSFFVAMSVEIKAKHTVYQLFIKFIMRNMEWKIDQYDRSKDTLYAKKNLNANNNNNRNVTAAGGNSNNNNNRDRGAAPFDLV